MNQFYRRRVQWSQELAERYWDFESSNPHRSHLYFSGQVGESIVRYVERRAGLRSPVLDYGCGPGFLLERIVARGVRAVGVDFSAESLAAARERLASGSREVELVHATGFPLPLEANRFSRVFMIETVEHLLPDSLEGTIQELRRVLAPDGILVATTPNSEDLRRSETMCPECGAVFHGRQHVSSWDQEELAQLMRGHGLDLVSVEAVTFRQSHILNPVRETLGRLEGRRRPHLVCIARKP